MSGIRVLVVVDRLARQGMWLVLSNDKDIEVVGYAENDTEFEEKVVALSPDVVLVDVEMPQVNALATTRKLKDQGFPGAVVGLGTDSRQLDDALRQGMLGFLLKSAPDEEMVGVISKAPEGELIFGDSVMNNPEGLELALSHMGHGARAAGKPPASTAGKPPASTAGEPPASAPPAEADEPANAEAVEDLAGTGAHTIGPSDIILSRVEFVISAPTALTQVLKFQKWLMEST